LETVQLTHQKSWVWGTCRDKKTSTQYIHSTEYNNDKVDSNRDCFKWVILIFYLDLVWWAKEDFLKKVPINLLEENPIRINMTRASSNIVITLLKRWCHVWMYGADVFRCFIKEMKSIPNPQSRKLSSVLEDKQVSIAIVYQVNWCRESKMVLQGQVTESR
jgi:hypothetical protein